MLLSDLYTADMIELMELHEAYDKHEWKLAGCSVANNSQVFVRECGLYGVKGDYSQVFVCECGLYGVKGDYTNDKTIYPVWGWASAEPHWFVPRHHRDMCQYEAYRQLCVWVNQHLRHIIEERGIWPAIIMALKMETGINNACPRIT